MKYTCARCKKELEYSPKEYGGYAVTQMKDLCPECWNEYTEIKNRQYRELNSWWGKEPKARATE